jgi:hypothetical protein
MSLDISSRSPREKLILNDFVEPALFLLRSAVLINDVDQIVSQLAGVIHLSSNAPSSGLSV